MEELFVSLMISSFVFGFAGSFVAKNKGVTQKTGFWLGFFLGPIGLIIVALLNPTSVRHTSFASQFNGDRDLSSDRYQLWLTQKYDIQRNEALSRFVVGEDSYISLEDALNSAHRFEELQFQKSQDEAERSIFIKKRLIYIALVFAIGAVVLFAGKLLLNYADHQSAVAAANDALQARRGELVSALKQARVPLIPSAKMTEQNNLNDMPTDELKNLGFITSTIERPTGDMFEICSIGSGTVRMTDFGGSLIGFGSSDSPEEVRRFYVTELKKAGFVRASEFQGDDDLRIEYADKRHVIFMKSSLIEGSTNVGICILNRIEMEKALTRSNDYDRKIKALESDAQAAQERLERHFKANQKLIDSYQ